MKQKIKLAKRFTSAVVTVAMVLSMFTGIGGFFPETKSKAAANATLYISHIAAASYDWNQPGYVRLSCNDMHGNCNRGCGSKSANIFLWVKTTTNQEDALTKLWVYYNNDKLTSIEGYAVGRYTGDLNAGCGSKSTDVYIYGTKDPRAGDPITSLAIWNNYDKHVEYAGGNSGNYLSTVSRSGGGSVEQDWEYIKGDLNDGAGGAYIHIYCRRSARIVAQDKTADFNGDYVRGKVTSSSSGASITYSNDGQLQVGSNSTNYSVYKAGVQYETVWGTFTNTVTDTYGYANYVKLDNGLWIGAKAGVEAPTSSDYTYSATDGLTVKSDKQMVLFATNSSYVMKGQIKVADGIAANLAIRNINITRNTQGAAISVNPAAGKTATITAYGTNTLNASGAYAAIQKKGDGKLVINGSGIINANAGSSATYGAAGIGGGTDRDVTVVSNIEISGSVTVNAKGSSPSNESYLAYGAAGVGSQYNMPVDGIKIAGSAKVTAIGGNGAAGIGSGANANANNIEIAGGTVNATAGSASLTAGDVGGAGIGSGAYISGETKTATNIVVSGGTVTAVGGNGAAGIGSGTKVDASNIKVTGGTIEIAKGKEGGAGIGSGADANASDIVVSGGKGNVAGGANAAGIGSGINGKASNIKVSGSINQMIVTGGANAAGIGSGANASVDNINISLADDGMLLVYGGDNGAGIGSGATSSAVTEATNINISTTGTLIADVKSGKGAGIGAGFDSKTSNINITSATGKKDGEIGIAAAEAPAIGAYEGDVKNVNVLTDATVIIDSIEAVSVGALYNGSASEITIIGDKIYGSENLDDVPTLGTVSNSMLFVRDIYDIYGTASLLKNAAVKSGTTLSLESSTKLIIPEGVEMTVEAQANEVAAAALVWADNSDAQLIINGTLTVKGSMAMDSEYGTIILNGDLNLADNANIYGKFFNNGRFTGNGIITRGKDQKREDGEIAVYFEMDIDHGVTYDAKGIVAGKQLLIDESALENSATAQYVINNIEAQDGFTITDIKLDDKSIINDSSYITKAADGSYKLDMSVADYVGETVKFSIKASSTVESIKIESLPAKTQYAKGGELDLAGLKVIKTYKDGHTALADVKELKLSGYDMNQAAAQEVTVTYVADDKYSDGVTTSFNITVFDFVGINEKTTVLKLATGDVPVTKIDNINHIVEFALEENVGDITALKSAITLKPQGFTNKVGEIVFDGSNTVGQNAIEATYSADIYVDKDQTVVIPYKVIISQPTLLYDLSDAKVDIAGSYTYDGTRKLPELEDITVTIGELTVPSDYYTVEYAENINAGATAGIVTITGDGVNTSKTVEGTFEIAKAQFTDVDALVTTKEYVVQNDEKHELPIEFAEIEGLSANDYTVTYSKASDTNNIVAKIEDGIITTSYDTSYTKAGEATINVNVTIKPEATNFYATGTLTHQIKVTLTKYVKGTSITLTSDFEDFKAEGGNYKVTLFEGERAEINATLNAGSNDVVAWEVTEGEDVVNCSNGSISALKAGTATIVASTNKGAVKKTITVVVNPTTTIELAGTASYDVLLGGDEFVIDVDLKDRSLAYLVDHISLTSSDESVVTVSENGEVTIVGGGSATITAIAVTDERGYDAERFEITVNVKVLAKSITLDQNKISLDIDDSMTLAATIDPENATDKEVVWSVENDEIDSIVSVDQNGKVTARRAGTALVKCELKSDENVFDICEVTVNPLALESIKLEKTSVTVNIGKIATLSPVFTPAKASNKELIWTSSNTKIAKVSGGKITPVAPGKVTITCTSKENSAIKATCTVTVKDMLKSATIKSTTAAYTGKEIKPAVTVKSSLGTTLKNGTDYTVTYKNNKAIGKATITVTGKGYYTGTRTLSFVINPAKVTKLAAKSAKAKNLTVTFNKAAAAAKVGGYEIQVSTDKAFKKGVKKVTSTKNSVTISKLTSKKSYYVRVRAYKKVSKTTYNSAWVNIAKPVKVK